jgi:CheY-like chemotaxis protein
MGDSKMANAAVRVLVVEDDADDRELLLRQLTKSGMDSHVKFISNGREALDFLTGPDSRVQTEELVAIFLDLKLPAVGGLELLRLLRLRGELQDIPVIVMTSSNDPKDLEECQKLRVINYVTKPVTFTSFSKAVADVFHLPKPDSPLPPVGG